ncbi:TonB-dependent receptor [Gilliamella apis]|uniref:TonB-dependent receptor n=1 Tax=Gilliamella apis TaxID=1970738 RepID=UPI00274050D9|nr:TonB-dependent receptor [Gilliamella apis]WLT05588.1 TonB-dependent receptor [Gilliamella apis]
MRYKLVFTNKITNKALVCSNKSIIGSPWLMAGILCLSFNAMADTVEEKDDSNQVEQLIVTARHVKESAKDIPFTVNIVDDKKLVDRRETTLEKALNDTVGVQVISNMGAAKSIRMRGVGSVLPMSGDDSSVSINVDGMPQSKSNTTLNLLDVQRVEVLKGPQGTLFGRNSEAGAINVISKKPTRHFESAFRTEFGQNNQILTEGVISGPLSDQLSARFAVRYDEADSILENVNDHKPVSILRNKIARGTLLWEASELTSISFITEIEEAMGMDDMYMMRPYGHHPKIDIPNSSDKNDKNIYRFNLKVEHELDNSLLSSITGYSYSKSDRRSPIYEGRLYHHLSGMSPPSNWSYLTKENLFTQEFRISSKPEAPIFWVAGINYYTNDRHRNTYDVMDVFYPSNALNANIRRQFETDNVGVFGEVTYPVTEKLKLTAGLRQSYEKKNYHAKWLANSIYAENNKDKPTLAFDKQKITDNFTTGRLGLNFLLNDYATLYGLYSRGYKTGGFNDEGTDFATVGRSDQAYKSAYVNAYEIGLKAENNSVGLNTAFFYNDTKREHLMAYNPATFVSVVENYDIRSYGVELDGFWKAPGNLDFSGGIGYTNAKIVGTPNKSLAHVKKHNEVPDTSHWNANLTILHSIPLNLASGISLETQITDRYIGSRQADVQNKFGLKAYNKLDARIAVKTENAEFYVWGDNLLNKSYDLWGYHIPALSHDGPDATIGSPGRGRTLGVGFIYNY